MKLDKKQNGKKRVRKSWEEIYKYNNLKDFRYKVDIIYRIFSKGASFEFYIWFL